MLEIEGISMIVSAFTGSIINKKKNSFMKETAMEFPYTKSFCYCSEQLFYQIYVPSPYRGKEKIFTEYLKIF